MQNAISIAPPSSSTTTTVCLVSLNRAIITDIPGRLYPNPLSMQGLRNTLASWSMGATVALGVCDDDYNPPGGEFEHTTMTVGDLLGITESFEGSLPVAIHLKDLIADPGDVVVADNWTEIAQLQTFMDIAKKRGSPATSSQVRATG